MVAAGLVFALLIAGCIKQSENGSNQTCGGIAGIKCPEGYECIIKDKSIADGAGYCMPKYVDTFIPGNKGAPDGIGNQTK